VLEAATAATLSHRHPPSSLLVSFTISELHHRWQSSSRHRQLLKSENKPSSEKGTLSCLPDIFIHNLLLHFGYFYPQFRTGFQIFLSAVEHLTSGFFYPQLWKNDFWIFLSAVEHLTSGFFYPQLWKNGFRIFLSVVST